MIATRLKLDDINGKPTVLMGGIPGPLRIGDPLGLRFRISRQTGGRYEVLEVSGQFRVLAVGFDLSTTPCRQLLTVESLGRPPTWASLKKPVQRASLAPAISPRTPV